ncbi:MAG: peptidoglycan DD-metalloendopeptidase family protein [Chloroflexi bacterium]|nr:peptidoglycan DD-metalloendopeptidase family protein [Chloroflexota bacterium]
MTPESNRTSPDVDDSSRESRPAWFRLWEDLVRSGLREPILRSASHFLVLGLVILFSWMARPSLWSWLPARINLSSAATPTVSAPLTAGPAVLPAFDSGAGGAVIDRAILLHTDVPARPRVDVTQYTVQQGDSLFAIAARFNLTPETILWGNYSVLKDDPHTLRPGQVLNILPVDGTYYQWQEGDGLNGVAKFFSVTPDVIVNWPGNGLEPNIDPAAPGIAAGSWIVIPGGRREFVQWRVPILRRTDKDKWQYGGDGACQGPYLSDVKGENWWVWPSDSHAVTGNQYSSFHPAIDLHGRLGDNIYAAASGVVVFAGWSNWGYGNLIVVDHGNGWQTVYAHLSQLSVGCGFNVYQGNVIGYIGSTGNSTGPHLHFEMQSVDYGKVNPLDFLP